MSNTTPSFRTSPAGLKLIKDFEGFKRMPQNTTQGFKVIGYGYMLINPHFTQVDSKITPYEAETLLVHQLIETEKAICYLVQIPMNQNQFDALVSLVYSIGIIEFKHSNLLYVINTGYKALAMRRDWMEYVMRYKKKSGKSVVQRLGEIELFFKPS